jgi:hypothetical protein
VVIFDAMRVSTTLACWQIFLRSKSDIQSNTASIIIVSFDTYLLFSLKQLTRQRRKGDVEPIEYDVSETTDISKVSLKQLLSHSKTKNALTKFLASTIHDHLKKKNKSFIVAGNGKSVSSGFSIEGINNHEESDTLMRRCLALVDITDKVVCVKSNDTDVFVIMLGLQHRLNCQQMLIEWTSEKWIDVTRVHQEIGKAKAEAIIGFHCFTGCDTVEKFSGKTKSKWTQAFLKCSPSVINAFIKLSTEVSDDILCELESFTASVYNPKCKKRQTLGEVRWSVYIRDLRKKKSNNTKGKRSKKNIFESMAPTSGAFLQHVRRSHVVAQTLSQSDKAVIDHINPAGFGWRFSNERYEAVITDEPMAPAEVLNPDSCSCNTNCSTGHCPCKKDPAIPCSQFCACSEDCENTDPSPTMMIEDDDDDEDDVVVDNFCDCSGKCGTVRCRCRSEKVSCNDGCSCDSEQCTNGNPQCDESDNEDNNIH